ncbi:MAG: hypothetical protein J7L41_05515 [Synergistetes bacterium]|nr:hypothetical protein [Synergistota bacterium]
MRRGFALLWVIIVLAFLGIISVSLFFVVNTQQVISKNYLFKERAFWAMEGGREWGRTCFSHKYIHPEADWFPSGWGWLSLFRSSFYLSSISMKEWKIVGSISVSPSYDLIFKRDSLIIFDNGEECSVRVYEDNSSETARIIATVSGHVYFYLKFDLVIFGDGSFKGANSVVRSIYTVEYRWNIF